MSTFDTICSFKMYRGRLDNRKLAEEDLRRIVDAAHWAPSGHNSQPWEFLVIDDRQLIEQIASIVTKNFDSFIAQGSHLPRFVENFGRWLRWSREELASCGDGIYFRLWSEEDWAEFDTLTDEHSIRDKAMTLFGSKGVPSRLISTAPNLLITLLDTEREIPDYSNDMTALTSAGAAMQNLRLTAHEMGIAVHEQSILYDLPETRKEIIELLEIPTHFKIVGGMRLGYRTDPVKSAFTHVRRPVDQIMHHNRYS